MGLKSAIRLAFVLLWAGCAVSEDDPATPEQAVAPVVVEDFQPVPGLLRIGPEPQRAIPLVEV